MEQPMEQPRGAGTEVWPPAVPGPECAAPRPLNMHERGLILSVRFFAVGAAFWLGLAGWMLYARDWGSWGLIVLFGCEAAGFAGVALYGWGLRQDVRTGRKGTGRDEERA